MCCGSRFLFSLTTEKKVEKQFVVPTRKRKTRPSLALTLGSWSSIKKPKTSALPSTLTALVRTGLDLEKMRQIYESPETEEDKSRGITTEFALYLDPWKIKKKLTVSDLGNLSRLMVSKELIKNHVLAFFSEEDVEKVVAGGGKRVEIFDLDTKTHHYLILKHWSTSRCFVLNERWIPDFVKRRSLKEGDLIALCWDSYYSRFNFSILTRAARV